MCWSTRAVRRAGGQQWSSSRKQVPGAGAKVACQCVCVCVSPAVLSPSRARSLPLPHPTMPAHSLKTRPGRIFPSRLDLTTFAGHLPLTLVGSVTSTSIVIVVLVRLVALATVVGVGRVRVRVGRLLVSGVGHDVDGELPAGKRRKGRKEGGGKGVCVMGEGGG